MFGAVLRQARLAANLTQELSFRAGVDRSYVSQLENGHKSPTLDVLFLLAEALGVRASALIARVEDRRQQQG
jgi:transcriptional regulator with XRE-family HTH domain